MKRYRPTYLLTLLAALALSAFAVACGGDDTDEGAGAPVTVTETAPPASPPAATDDDDDAEGDDNGDNGTTSGEGETFEVEDAGSVTLSADGNRLVIVSVDPASGWTHRVSEEERREIEIDFLRDGRKVYEFEAELEDGGIEAKVEREDED